MTNKGFAGFTSTGDGSITAGKLAVPLGWGSLVSGYYYYTMGQFSPNSNNTLGVGTLRLAPWFVPNAVTLSRIGGEVTSGGDSGSKLRLGIYADNGNGYPGSLVLDAGTIAGDSATVQEITISQALTPGLYWVGGAVQVVSVTQPTVRINGAGPLLSMPVATATPSSNQSVGFFSQTSVTGAFPAVFSSTLTTSATGPRVFVKVA